MGRVLRIGGATDGDGRQIAPYLRGLDMAERRGYSTLRWGAFSEFERLYIKNHLPILRRYQARGYILAMSATFPITHGAESVRWDMRFDITWRDAAAALEELPDADAITQELFPDQEAFQREEQRRFELLVEHMDIPVMRFDPATW